MSNLPGTEPMLDMTINAAMALFKRVYPNVNVTGLSISQMGPAESPWRCEFRTANSNNVPTMLSEPVTTGQTIHAALSGLINLLTERVRTRKAEDEKALAASDRVNNLLQQPSMVSVTKA